MATVRDKLWIFAHAAGSHNRVWNLPGQSRITPAEAALYMDIPNLIMVRYEDLPEPPYDQYAVPLRPLNQVVWSVVGKGGATDAKDRDLVLDLAGRLPNMTGVFMDDFFRPSGDPLGTLTTDELRALRPSLSPAGRDLDLWVVLYDHQLHLPVGEYLPLFDKVTFWTWEAPNLENLEANFEKAEKLSGGSGLLLGCYMWDYGLKNAMPMDRMRRQCELGLNWLREGRIEGMIFLASCICDLELEPVEWTRSWIAEVGGEEI